MSRRMILIFIFSFTIFISGCDIKFELPFQKKTFKQIKLIDNLGIYTKEYVVINANKLPNESLRKGQEGKSVHYLQLALIQLGYPLEPTKKYDELTTWAITDLQLKENIMATGIYDDETNNVIKSYLNENASIKPGEFLQKPTGKDSSIVENPYDVLALVNKEHALPPKYEPNDLTIPNVRFPFNEDHPKKQLRKIAANALEKLFAAGDDAGVHLFAQSGYRSYHRQESIFVSNTNKHGEDYANRYSARPGESEHQTGLVMDVTSADVGYLLVEEFEDTAEGKWLKDHAHKFGFIIRYPKNKEDITGYVFEPWHLRYLGVDIATKIYENDLTYEEYLIEEGIYD